MSEDNRDEEEVFWERFFERLQPAKNAGKKILNKLDSSPIGVVFDQIDGVINNIAKRGHSIGQRLAEFWYATILRSPGIIIVLLLLSSVYLCNLLIWDPSQ